MTFLSLNIHEALTFETEICLHPDLFNPSNISNANIVNNVSSDAASTGRHSVVMPPATTTAEQPASNTAAAATGTSTTTTTTTLTNNAKPLQAGDLIEIRVWDGPTTLIGAGGGSSSFHSTSNINVMPPVLRRRPSPPPPPPPSAVESSNASLDPSNKASQQQEDGESTSLASSTDARNTNSSLRSTDNNTPHASPRTAEDHKTTTLTPVPTTTTTTTTTSLPPPIPRGRASTVDSPALLLNINNNKPPLPSHPPAPPSVRHSPKQPRHVRDISDISDTTFWAAAQHHQNPMTATTATTSLSSGPLQTTTTAATTTTLDSSHQLVDLQVPFTTNTTTTTSNAMDDVTADDDEDDEESEDVSSSQQQQQQSSSSSSHTMRLKFYMLLNEASLASLKPSARTQVSLLRQVADLYHLSSYDMVTVHRVVGDDNERIVRQQMAAEFVLVTIKDSYLSRGDLHFFQQSLQGSFLYEGQRLHNVVRGIQAHAREIRNVDNHVTPTAIVTEHTKIAYRSRSSRIFWLVQVSAELYEYSAPFSTPDGRCEVYFDKFMAFCYELFEKWKSVEVTHSLTVVFFSRTFFNAFGTGATEGKGRGGGGCGTSTVQKDVFGRYYEDHYRIVIENETRPDWASLILQIRQAFWQYPTEVEWNLAADETGRWPSTAAQGNVLEAINVTLNLLQYHYLDRDLHRTGNSIVVVSAGNGVFEVSKELSQITHQRMMDNGIGSDMLSLGLPPLHTAPFFMYVKEHQSVGADGVDSSESYFEVPHWMHLSFVSYESDAGLPTDEKANDGDTLGSVLLAHSRIEVGPNGFIRRHWARGVESNGKLSPHATTTSIASPARRIGMAQERQLIEGRDFSDILRASRPRFRASLPAPFRLLLKNQGREQSTTIKSRDESVVTSHSGGKSSNIHEWNSMESDDASEESIHIRGRGLSLGQDPLDGTSPIIMPKSPPRVDMLDSLSAGSPSSYATQASGGALASSPGRQQEFLVRPHLSPKLTGMQLQRARSLEIETDDRHESVSMESYTALSGASFGADKPETYDIGRMLDLVKDIMKTSDQNCLKVESPKLMPQSGVDRSRHSSTDVSNARSFRSTNLSKSPKFGPRALSARSIPNPTTAAPSGGIGAALSQYRGSATSLSSDTDGSTNISRVSSYSRLQNSALIRIPEMISAGMSPLLLPPTQKSYDPVPDSQSGDKPSSGPERRIVDVQRVGSVDGSFLRPARGHQLDLTPTSSDRRMKATMPSSPPKPSMSSSVKLSKLPSQSKRSQPEASRKKKAFNPFRQQDEDAVLAEKSHNRRRWSHVFPATEVEFKRHAGPNWKSLSAPAILPISVDYFPPQAKIDLNFRISQYSINVSDFEHRNFSSTKFLLMEMVRQRITQDFQLVPRSNVNASNYRKEWLSRQVVFNDKPNAPEEDDQGDRVFLSMGHRLQVLSYVPSADTVHVTQYTERSSAAESSYKYYYMSYSKETKQFVKCVQSFHKFASPYNWNKVDRILSGDTDRELREGMRAKRLMFVILPEKFTKSDGEEKYVAKFKRLLDYFVKLQSKDEAEPLYVRIVTSSDQEQADESEDRFDATPGIEGKSMVRFYIPLRKGRVDQFEYTEISLDATFNTAWTYRIIVSWLSASTTKMDTQVQSLQRRCTQYGLSLIPAPHVSVSQNVFLNPLRAPTLFSVRDRFKVPILYTLLLEKEYIYDGVFPTEATSIAECIQGGSDFKFRRWGKLPQARQFIHCNGCLFVRIVVDRQGWALIVAYANYRVIGRDDGSQEKCCAVVRDLRDIIKSLDKSSG